MSYAVGAMFSRWNEEERERKLRQMRDEERMKILGGIEQSPTSAEPSSQSVMYCHKAVEQPEVNINKPLTKNRTEQSKLQRILRQVGIGTRRIAIAGALAYALFFPHSYTSISEIDDVPHSVHVQKFRIIPTQMREAYIDLISGRENYTSFQGFFKSPMSFEDSNHDLRADYVRLNQGQYYFRDNYSGEISDSVFKYADKELVRTRQELRIGETLAKIGRTKDDTK